MIFSDIADIDKSSKDTKDTKEAFKEQILPLKFGEIMYIFCIFDYL